MNTFFSSYIPSASIEFVRAYVGARGSEPYTYEYASDRFSTIDRINQSWLKKSLSRETYEIFASNIFRETYPEKGNSSSYTAWMRYMFADHILGRTRCASGGINRRTFLTGLRDLQHGVLNSSFSFPLTKMLERSPTMQNGASWLSKCLSYSDTASLWSPIDVSSILKSKSVDLDHVVAVCGSWGAVAIACDIIHDTNPVRKHTCIDVIEDLRKMELSRKWPFIYTTIISPSQTVVLNDPGTTFVWNPPYFSTELYDTDDGQNQHQDQSTYGNNDITSWIESYVIPTALCMSKSAIDGARMLFVTTDIIKVHASMRQLVNVKGFEKKTGMYEYANFHTTLIDRICARTPWNIKETSILRDVHQGAGKRELLTVFENHPIRASNT